MPGLNRRFVAAMLRREARASRRRMVLYGSCMALGIAALVGLHGLRAATRHALDEQAQRLLGADLRISSRAPLSAGIENQINAILAGSNDGQARMTRFGSMAMAARSGRSRLVDVQAAEATYPLYGAVHTEPAGRWVALHDSSELQAIVDPSLLIQLDAKLGDELIVGAARFRIVATIRKAPGSFGMQTQIAPRVLIARHRLAATELLRPGSLVDYLHFLRVEEARLTPWLEANRASFEDAHLRLQTVAGQQGELDRSFGMMTRYLGLVGLAALALGGVGVAAGVRVLVREKLDTVALLRSLGAQSRDVFVVYGLLALLLGGLAGGVGSLLGVGLQWGLPIFMQGLLPVEVTPRFELGAVLTGIGLGLWVTLLFAAGPLIDLVRVPPLRSLRADFGVESMPLAGRIALWLALGLSLLLVSLWQAPRLVVGFAFAAGLAVVLAVLAAAAWLCARLLRDHPPRRAAYWLRQGVANLFRPRNHTVSTVLTVGFGLFLVSTLHGVQRNVLREIAIDSRPDRPNLVLFDVQPDQVDMVETFLASRDAEIQDRAALISARIARVGGRPISAVLAEDASNRELRWALQREYRLTWGAELRESETLVAGHWWQSKRVGESEPIAVSLETSIAESLSLEVGDEMTWDVQGVPVRSVVENIREVDWGRFATNFFVVFPPGLIEQAPSTTVMLARIADPQTRAEVQRDLVRDFPNISILDASVILHAFETMMQRIAVAVRVLALFALSTGFMILIAAAATAREERTREVLLLRTLGASSRTLRRIVATEAVALGGLAALLGAGLSLLASWALVRFVFELSFSPPWVDSIGLALASFAISAGLGGLNGRPVRAASPLAALRSAETRGTS